MNPIIISNRDQNTLFSNAVDEFFKSVKEVQSEFVVVALPGGRSVVSFLKLLVSEHDALAQEHWNKIQFFMLDDRLVDLGDEDCNFTLVSSFLINLVSAGCISSSQMHPYEFDPNTEDYGLNAYEETLKTYGGHFNIAVMGVGEDGHVGALYPNHHSIKNNSEYFFSINDSPKPPAGRMTSSRKLVSQTETVFTLFLGSAKLEALQNFQNDQISIEQCPAKLALEIPQSYVVTNLL